VKWYAFIRRKTINLRAHVAYDIAGGVIRIHTIVEGICIRRPIWRLRDCAVCEASQRPRVAIRPGSGRRRGDVGDGPKTTGSQAGGRDVGVDATDIGAIDAVGELGARSHRGRASVGHNCRGE